MRIAGMSVFLLALAAWSWSQTEKPLRQRVPAPQPEKYVQVRDARDWKNPFLIVRPDGIEILGMTPLGRAIAVGSVQPVLEGLPVSEWPYGLIVAVQDIGIQSRKTDRARIEANLVKLLHILKQLGISVDRWPSA